MRTIFFCGVLLVLVSGCSTPRVLVRDCADAGKGLKNCELVQKL